MSTSNLSSISKLVPEILEDIFLLLSLSAIPDENYDIDAVNSEPNLKPSDESRKWDWLVVVGVCRDWRRIGFGFSALWTHIDPRWCKDRVQAYLKRSQNADIYILLPNINSRKKITFQAFYKTINIESGRIRELSILDLIPSCDWRSIRRIFSSRPMASLRRLRLRSFKYSPLLVGHPNSLATLMSSTQLDHLFLSAITLPWNHHLLKGLRELILEDIREVDKLTVPELLDILEGCPKLSLLMLSGAGPKLSGSIARRSHSIALSQLRDVSIADLDFRTCEQIFGSLEIPIETSFFFGCNNYPFHSPIPFPAPQLNRSMQRNKAIITINDDTIIFQTAEDMEKRSISHVQLRFSLDLWTDDPDLSEVFGSIPVLFSQPIWGNITAVDVDMSGKDIRYYWRLRLSMSLSSWESLLNQLHAIQELRLISVPNSTYLTEGFVSVFTRKNDTHPYHFKCPNLRSLTLMDVSFSTVHEPEAMDSENLKSLVNHLTFRHETSGEKLRRFSLIRCDGVSRHHYEMIREIGFCEELNWEQFSS